MIEDLFDWHETDSYALLNEHDESRKTPGLFLVGPQVRHEDLILCFIYKYRQRFGVVANAIGERLEWILHSWINFVMRVFTKMI